MLQLACAVCSEVLLLHVFHVDAYEFNVGIAGNSSC